jgi:hypothetical protein
MNQKTNPLVDTDTLTYLTDNMKQNILWICHSRWLFPTKPQFPNQSTVFFLLALQPPWALASDFQFHNHFTDGRTPWTSDQLQSRPLLKHTATQTQNKHIHIPNIHALCGIRTHDPCFWASDQCLKKIIYRAAVSQRLRTNPCGGGVEYFHRDPASRKRRRNGTKKGRAIA